MPELETAVSTFREIIKQSWTRRAIRMLTISQPPALLPKLTIADVTSLRDSDWETREKAFHDTALEEINSLVRKHNGLAPYAVRRPYYMRVAELEKVYRDSGEDILRGLSERTEPRSRSFTGSSDSDEGDAPVAHHPGMDTSLAPLRIRDVFRQWISAWRGGKQ